MGKIAIVSVMMCILIVLAPMLTAEKEDMGTAESAVEEGYTVIPGEKDEVQAENANTVDSQITIPVLTGGEVRYLKLDEYLEGVLAAEMPASFPDEALKAQAVAARTFIIHKRSLVEAGEMIDSSHKGAIMCDDPAHCSAYTDIAVNASSVFGDNADAYTEKIRSAVRDTDGIIMTYGGEPITSSFHAISGGRTENAADVWGCDVPYLRSVESSEDETAAMYESDVAYSTDELRALLTSQLPDSDLSGETETWFKDSVRSEAGGIITVELGGVEVKGTWLRSVLSLASTDFTVEHEDGKVVFHCIGYGHGVGMSQYGAKQKAEHGAGYEEILKHYYTGVTTEKLSR